MQEKAFTLHNKGMNRDLSISKAGESAAYENHNIRIVARDHDTALSVTNERGNKEIALESELGIQGELLGWNVLDNHIILFTHKEGDERPDFIYRIDYDAESDSFSMVKGSRKGIPLFNGDLNFSLDYPIESVVYHETELIQKAYWIDGMNPLRFINFMASDTEMLSWDDDGSDFESNKAIAFTATVNITKDHSGNTRPNGVIQYILTYYNKHGQESGYAWMSDIIYLAPPTRGGSADGSNTTKVTIEFKNLDRSYTNYRIYSIFRSTLNAVPVAHIVSEGTVPQGDLDNVIVVDDYANQSDEDYTRLLYLGSQPVIAGTMTHKDQTLFLGDLRSIGRGSYAAVEDAVKMMRNQATGILNESYLRFELAPGTPIPDSDELYPYENQLAYSSSQIKSFKGGEKYRFAIVFRFKDGSSTDAFWIGDAINPLYPEMDEANGAIKRVIAKCFIPQQVFNALPADERNRIETVQLMMAEATYADRAVKAQGILNPTVFNVWERYNDRVYSESSWISRPRNSGFANRHFEAIHNSTSSTGEIDCNYWNEGSPYPYYRLQKYNTAPEYAESFDGLPDYDFVLIVLGMGTKGSKTLGMDCYSPSVSCVKVKMEGDYATEVMSIGFQTTYKAQLDDAARNGSCVKEVKDNSGELKYTLTFYDSGNKTGLGYGDVSKEAAYAFVRDFLANTANISEVDIPLDSAYDDYCDDVYERFDASGQIETLYQRVWSNSQYTTRSDQQTGKSGWYQAFDYYPSGGTASSRWTASSIMLLNDSLNYMPSYYKKHLMFVDENVITLNSPEIDSGLISFDNVSNYKLRIVGVAKITSSVSDYTVDATPGKLPGENLIDSKFSAKSGTGNLDGLLSWPLWYEYGLVKRDKNPDGTTYTNFPTDKDNATSYDYKWSSSKNLFWLHMWNHIGRINGYTDEENNDYSTLKSKVFANMRIAAKTVYNDSNSFNCVYSPSSIRLFNYTSSQYVGIDVNGDTKYYDGIIKTALMPPGTHKYHVLYSLGIADTSKKIDATTYDLALNTSVPMDYYSNPHAVISLPISESGEYYDMTTLPFLPGDNYALESRESATSDTPEITGALLPWIDNNPGGTYPYIDARINPSQPVYTPKNSAVTSSDKFLYIGEIYYDYSAPGAVDNRYGGIKPSDVERNRFVVAGPPRRIQDILNETNPSNKYIIGNDGDTYFQRWDCLKTKPFRGATNGVIDITSVMLETHINIDGRTDLQRGMTKIASIDPENFGLVNEVYSQQDNFYQRRDLDNDFNLDSYRSSITWTLQKSDSASIDEWTHITLASTLKLDGDAGICRALRRFQNSIIAFQDKGVSEVLFNSRTQLSTTDGVPVEIANSGKVDGKRYITNKYGCINKWSIVEGKTGLYFIDNINKAFCAFSGNGIDSLSDKLGFGVWFKDVNVTEPWKPSDFKNFVSFYDREHSDIYLVKDSDDEMPCLVYNENLQAFTSFFDYNRVPMMTNVRDRFVSFRDNSLWLQNEGLYCNFFGSQHDFWIQYRVTPEPFSDKIWTNFDYRADFYHTLDSNGKSVVPEEYLINGDRYLEMNDMYKEHETFTDYRAWNEYQDTGRINILGSMKKMDLVRKKFRIWRIAISRAIKEGTNVRGLDRIRNPWMNLLFRKDMSNDSNQYLMQLHDIVVKYFE